MKNGNVEDIFIGYNDIHTRKKGKKGVIIIFIILILLLAGMASAYFYFTNKTLTKKEIFINSISSTNIKKFLENNIYTEIGNRMLNENSETETKVTVSGLEESDELNGIDPRNLELNLINKNNVTDSKTYNELGINYSGNEIFKIKLQTTEDAIAVASDEIVDKFIGIRYDKMKDVFGIEFNKEDLENFMKSEKIEFTEEEKSEYLKKYVSKFFENIGEDKFVSQDNFVINKNNTSIDVISYSLNLSQEEYNNNLVEVLTMLRNDEELLGKIVTGKSSDKNEIMSPEEENFNSSFELDTSDLESLYTDDMSNLQGDSFSNYDDSTNNLDSSFSSSDDMLDSSSTSGNSLNTNLLAKNETLANIVTSLVFARKTDMTVQELQKEIDKEIETIKQSQGEGITVTVYVSENATEKISIVLPNKDTADIEFTKDSEDENNNTIQLTYLEDNTNKNSVVTYSAEDNVIEEDKTDVSGKKNGVSITLNKISKDAGNTLKITNSVINKEEVKEKIDFEIKTSGAKNAKTIKNDIVVGIKSNDGEGQIIVENNINFELTSEIEDLNNDNCAFLDDLSEEDRTSLISAITQRIMEVYTEKQNSLKVIDSNTGTSFVEQNNLNNMSSNVTKEEAKNALFNRVSVMMGEAQSNNEEFTIKNLENLEIEGYEVSSTVTEEAAVIVVDTYTFRITPNFELLED